MTSPLSVADLRVRLDTAMTTAGLGAGTREKLEQTVRGYENTDETAVTPEQFRRDLSFVQFTDALVDAIVENVFFDGSVHVYPPYELVDETATSVRIGSEEWTADHEVWPAATCWTSPSSSLERNSTLLCDAIRAAMRDGESVLVCAEDTVLFDSATDSVLSR
jgi:hypothetical protein